MKRIKSKLILHSKNVLHLIIVCLSIGSIFFACKDNHEDLIDTKITEFINSKDFQNLNLSKGLSINIEMSKVTFDQKNVNRPVIHLVLNKGEKIIAILDVIKNTNKKIILPNNEKFFMLYRDVSAFDFKSLSGQIKLIDINYDQHIINTLEYIGSENVKSDFKSLDIKIMQKYSKVIESNYQYINTKGLSSKNDIENVQSSKKIALTGGTEKNSLKKVLCDGNHNGDLSFSECYACMNGSCASNSDCYTLCYGLGDVVMWVASGVPYCQTSIGISCIYLSIEY